MNTSTKHLICCDLQKSAAYTETSSIQDVLVFFLIHSLISQSTHHAVLRTPSDTALLLLLLPPLYLQDPSSLFLPCWLTSPTPQGMSHIGFPDVSGSTTCPAFSNELEPLWALGEFACCDWHLLGRTVWLWNRMKFRPILQQSNDRVRLNAWVKLQHIMPL